MEFTVTISVEECDIMAMCRLVINKGYTAEKAVKEYAKGWDDSEYYSLPYYFNGLVREVKRRVNR